MGMKKNLNSTLIGVLVQSAVTQKRCTAVKANTASEKMLDQISKTEYERYFSSSLS